MSFTYDANGNAMTRNGNAISWTSSNYPSRVNNGSEYTQFSYGPNRERWKQGYASASGTETTLAGISRHGYTDQYHLGGVPLIHMNGRVHDALSGRFLSPDPYVSEPLSIQGWNRYAYVANNPLSFVDPSGFVYCFSHRIEPGAQPQSNEHLIREGIVERCVEETIVTASRYPSEGGYFEPSQPPTPGGPTGITTGGGGGGNRIDNQAPQRERKDKCSRPSSNNQTFAQRTMENFRDINRLPGALAPPGTGLLTAGATSQAWLGTNAATLGRWAISGFRPITAGAAAFTVGESAILVGTAAAVNFALTGASYEVGALTGSAISAISGPGSSVSIRDWLADKMMQALGPKLEIPELACGW